MNFEELLEQEMEKLEESVGLIVGGTLVVWIGGALFFAINSILSKKYLMRAYPRAESDMKSLTRQIKMASSPEDVKEAERQATAILDNLDRVYNQASEDDKIGTVRTAMIKRYIRTIQTQNEKFFDDLMDVVTQASYDQRTKTEWERKQEAKMRIEMKKAEMELAK